MRNDGALNRLFQVRKVTKRRHGEDNRLKAVAWLAYNRDRVKLELQVFQLSGAGAMNEIATPNGETLEPDALIEVKTEILDQVRKDLSQEYTRFMSRLLKERLGSREGGSASVFEHLDSAPSLGSAQCRSSQVGSSAHTPSSGDERGT
jgi:hypothetical protein